jgi:hypothetical protein
MRIKRKDTAKRYAVSVRTVERWAADPALNFPPSEIIRGRRYDVVEKLDSWDRECATAARSTRTPPAAGRATARSTAADP